MMSFNGTMAWLVSEDEIYYSICSWHYLNSVLGARVCLSTVSFFIGWVSICPGRALVSSVIRYPLLYAGCLSTFSATSLKKRIWTALRMCKCWLLTGLQIVFEPLPLYKARLCFLAHANTCHPGPVNLFLKQIWDGKTSSSKTPLIQHPLYKCLHCTLSTKRVDY